MAAKRKIPKTLAWIGLGLALALAVLVVVYTMMIRGEGGRAALRERQLAEARALLATPPDPPPAMPTAETATTTMSTTHGERPEAAPPETSDSQLRDTSQALLDLIPASTNDPDGIGSLLVYGRVGTAVDDLLGLHAAVILGKTLPHPPPPIEWPKLPPSHTRYVNVLRLPWVETDSLTSPSLAVRRALQTFLDEARPLVFSTDLAVPLDLQISLLESPPNVFPSFLVEHRVDLPTAAVMILLRDAIAGDLPPDDAELRRRLHLALDLFTVQIRTAGMFDRFFDLLHHPAIAARLDDEDLAALQTHLARHLIEPERIHAASVAVLLRETEEAIREVSTANVSETNPLAHFMGGVLGRAARDLYAPIIRRNLHEAAEAAIAGDRTRAYQSLQRVASSADSLGLRCNQATDLMNLMDNSVLFSPSGPTLVNQPVMEGLFLLGVMRAWRAGQPAIIDPGDLPPVYTPVPIVLHPDRPVRIRPASHGGPICIRHDGIFSYRDEFLRGFRVREFGNPFDFDVIAWQLAPPDRTHEFVHVYTILMPHFEQPQEASDP